MNLLGNCPTVVCPAATTGSDLSTWTDWSDCQLSRDGTAGFQVRNRECSTGHCSEDVQEVQTCTHPGTTAGILYYSPPPTPQLSLFGNGSKKHSGQDHVLMSPSALLPESTRAHEPKSQRAYEPKSS
jgi:hypothetical protein